MSYSFSHTCHFQWIWLIRMHCELLNAFSIIRVIHLLVEFDYIVEYLQDWHRTSGIKLRFDYEIEIYVHIHTL